MDVQPGDLILVKSRGLVFRLGRRATGNAYDHVGVVTSDGRSINIDKPSTRVLPVERLLRESLSPLVLRPRFHDPEARARFVADIEALVDTPYDVRRTLGLVERLLERRIFRITRPLRDLGERRERWICTDAVLVSLERHLEGFAAVRDMPIDWVRLRSATTNDLLEISRRRPDLLAVSSPS